MNTTTDPEKDPRPTTDPAKDPHPTTDPEKGLHPTADPERDHGPSQKPEAGKKKRKRKIASHALGWLTLQALGGLIRRWIEGI
ncbi:hypothetical protein ABT024_29860 [Streptomyces sp. NPDC002812]|uniref:hypothetical protein n=1 Tax=Streptomyces sp. NPDC002812 TaxID=3154434 RepID=UPI0033269677